MKKLKVTAVFDIGKTNKKFFLFDKNFKEVYREYTRFEEIEDEDGYPTENLAALQNWLKDLFHRILEAEEYNVKAINFSTYGASFVHLDENGQVLTPLYNYLKDIDEAFVDDFYKKYGPEIELSTKTGSPKSGMLNSGLQLYWLKHKQPEVYKKIKYSLHLPQYLSYVFTGIPLSEYTSIGCHTALWDYEKKDYHQWVYAEEINKILPPLVSTETSIQYELQRKAHQNRCGNSRQFICFDSVHPRFKKTFCVGFNRYLECFAKSLFKILIDRAGNAGRLHQLHAHQWKSSQILKTVVRKRIQTSGNFLKRIF